jgi:hypothetical protein
MGGLKNAGRCFFLKDAENWYDAIASCQKDEAHLATFNDSGQANAVMNGILPVPELIWIGAYCAPGKDCLAKGSYQWLGSGLVGGNAWSEGEPDIASQRCVLVGKEGDTWKYSNGICYSPLRILCEKGI